MKSVMVFNFRTMQFEQATEAEGKEWLSLIEANNAECAAQQSVVRTPEQLDRLHENLDEIIEVGAGGE